MWVWLLACATTGPSRVLPEPWTALTWPAKGQALHASIWREFDQLPPDWQTPPISASNVYATQWWCSPSVPEDACWTGTVARAETRDAAWRGLSAVSAGPGQVTELVVDAGQVPADGNWGVALTLRIDAQDGTLDHWELALVRWAGNRLTASIDLGPDLTYRVEQTGFSVPGPAWQELVHSPESFRDQTVARLQALRGAVTAGIAGHRVQRCAYGRYWGDGSPRCDLVALSAQEEAGALAQAQTELDHRIRLVTQDAAVLHGMLRDLLPQRLR
jgi:hypothetical protein